MARGVGRTRRQGTLGRGMAVLAMLAGLAVPSVAPSTVRFPSVVAFMKLTAPPQA